MFPSGKDLSSVSLMACYEDVRPLSADGAFIQTIFITLLVTVVFLVCKNAYDSVRRFRARATIVVIGAGPIGLLSVLIAAKSKKASKIILYEASSRYDLVNRQHQIAIEQCHVNFLKGIGIDFDNIEGCWQHKRFFTRIGVLSEYILSLILRLGVPVDVKMKTQFTKERMHELDETSGKVLIIACDGSRGQTARLYGLSDEFVHHSCHAYGAVASLEKPEVCSVPTPETRVHNITFDLKAYGNVCSEDIYSQPTNVPTTQHNFHLKLFGSIRHRYISLAVPKCESKVVKILKVVLDRSIMRNIFQVCFNMYKTADEEILTDLHAIKRLRYSPRLFEIKLSHRLENVAYIEDIKSFVVTEGEAARCLNFHSGMDINLGLKSLYTLEQFLGMAVQADTREEIMKALSYKYYNAKSVTQNFVKNGIQDAMYKS